MKLISSPGKGYPYSREPRQELVTREEWEALFAPFPANVRHSMANLAAHNWHIVYDGERVGALGPSSYYGHWKYLDGSEVKMGEEEQNSFFPVADASMRDRKGYSTVWPERGQDGAYRPPIIRQQEIVIPEPECSACGGYGRIGPFYAGGISAACTNCRSPSPQPRASIPASLKGDEQ